MRFLMLSMLITTTCLTASCGSIRADDVTLKAYFEEPLGVAFLQVTDSSSGTLKTVEFSLNDISGDVLYPTPESGGRSFFLFNPKTAKSITFRGKMMPLVPVATVDSGVHAVHMDLWWKAFVRQAHKIESANSYPLEIEQYVLSMLAQRLGKPDVTLKSRAYLPSDDTSNVVAFLTGTESIRIAMQKESLLKSDKHHEAATEPLPVATSPPPVAIPEPANNVEVEPLAMMIPPECFYTRLASYVDLTWLRHRIDEWGTDLRDLSSSRGFDYHLSQRIQDQLELHDTALAQLLGPAVIDDIAIIGSDTFLREGAGIGVLFHARSNELLKQSLDLQRRQRAEKEPGITLTDVTFDGDEGKHSLLASPDNSVRSFYVAHGDFHLVTTSRTIARRFLEVARVPESSLGATKEFRYARTIMPLSRNDNAFLYLSDPFFRTFIRPDFRIEMTRRAQSESEMELVRMAALAAHAEGRPANSLQDLVGGGFLPTGFGQHADGSVLLWDGNTVADSLRGVRGAFIPVPDVVVETATPTEVASYAEFARLYTRIWQRMDPAVVGLRTVDEGAVERMIVDLHVFPFPRQQFGFLQLLSPQKAQQQLAPIAGAIFVAEANVIGLEPVIVGIMDREIVFKVNDDASVEVDQSQEPDWFFGGRPFKVVDSFLGTDFTSEMKEGEIIPRPNTGNYVPEGFVLRSGDYAFLAKSESTLENLRNKVLRIDADRPAELRVHVADLKSAKFTASVHAIAWNQANQISNGNVALLNRLVTLYHVASTDAATTAESIFNATRTNPLAGSFHANANGPVTARGNIAVGDYRVPLLNKMRGAEFELTTEGITLTTHFEVLMEKSP